MKLVISVLIVSLTAFVSCANRKSLPESSLDSNGKLTTAYPFVRRLERKVGSKTRAATGVLMATGFMLAPAHFLDASRPDCGVTVDGMRPVHCRIHPLYRADDHTQDGAAHDFGILFFSSKDSPYLQGKPNSIGLSSFSIGQTKMKVSLIGFGSPWVERTNGTGTSDVETGADMTGIGGDMTGIGGDMTGIDANAQATDGKKRICEIEIERDLLPEERGLGTNTGKKVGFTSFTVEYLISDSKCVPAPGDSGGPIIDSNNNLIGIASRVSYNGTKLSKATFVTISNDALMAFMAKNRREHLELLQTRRL